MNEKFENGQADYEQEYRYFNRPSMFAVTFISWSDVRQTKQVEAYTPEEATSIAMRYYNAMEDTIRVSRIGELR